MRMALRSLIEISIYPHDVTKDRAPCYHAFDTLSSTVGEIFTIMTPSGHYLAAKSTDKAAQGCHLAAFQLHARSRQQVQALTIERRQGGWQEALRPHPLSRALKADLWQAQTQTQTRHQEQGPLLTLHISGVELSAHSAEEGLFR